MGTVLAVAYLFPQLSDVSLKSVGYEYISGMLLFGMVFLACDNSQSPNSKVSRFLYGILIGIATIIFRRYSRVLNPVVFAVIVINPLAIAMDNYEVRVRKQISVIYKRISEKFPKATTAVEKINTVVSNIQEADDEE